MLRRHAFLLLAPALLIAGCSRSGGPRNPFVEEPPFTPTSVPADFAIVVDENHDTFVTRQHLQQVITAADSQSRTTYTQYRDYNNGISDQFTEQVPLSPSQMQAMWNDASRYDLLNGSTVWINWLAGADLYKRNSYTIQLRANGQTRTFRTTNGFSGPVRQLMFQLQSIRLPISQNANTPVVTAPPVAPAPVATAPAATAPATQATTAPATHP